MWKNVLATAASASVLVAGMALPGEVADPLGGEAAARAPSAASEDDDRVSAAKDALSFETAAQMLERQQAATARAAARSAEKKAAAELAAEQAAAARAAAERAAAELAAAEQAAQRAAAEKAVAQKAPLPTPTVPASTKPPRPVGTAPAPTVAWSTRVVDSGGQDAVNRCLGGLTRWYETVDGKPYYPIHRRCGGAPILALRLGDRVRIDGSLWVVTDARDVPRGAHYSAASGLDGQILLQTCYSDASTMRMVALTAA